MHQNSCCGPEENVIIMPDHSLKEVNYGLKNCLLVPSNDYLGELRWINIDSESDTMRISGRDNSMETGDLCKSGYQILSNDAPTSSETRYICNGDYQNVNDDASNSCEINSVNRFQEGPKQILCNRREKLSNVKDKTTCCPYCGKLFKSSRDLANHKYKVHSRNTKLYQCTKCDKNFYHNFDLNKHINDKHNGSKFKCDKCKSSFKTRFNLNRHAKKC